MHIQWGVAPRAPVQGRRDTRGPAEINEEHWCTADLARTAAVAGKGVMRLHREPPTALERRRGPESSHSGPLGAESRDAIAVVCLVAYPERIVQPPA